MAEQIDAEDDADQRARLNHGQRSHVLVQHELGGHQRVYIWRDATHLAGYHLGRSAA